MLEYYEYLKKKQKKILILSDSNSVLNENKENILPKFSKNIKNISSNKKSSKICKYQNNIENIERQFEAQFNFNYLYENPEKNKLNNVHEIILREEKNFENFYRIGLAGTVIGRQDDCDIIIKDKSLSRFHAEIFYFKLEKYFFLKDLG